MPDEVNEHLTRSETIPSSRITSDPSDSQLHVLLFSSLTHFLQGSGQRTGMASRSLVLCPVTHCCVVFEVCVWIIVRLRSKHGPNINKMYNRVGHLLIFYLLVFDIIHDAMSK